MTTIERSLAALIVLAGLVVLGWLGVMHYGGTRYNAGFADAVNVGKERLAFETELARRTEDALRVELRAKDDMAFTKEKKYVDSLAAAQRRMLIGVDSLRCPTGPVSAADASEHRPDPIGSEIDPRGSGLVPEASADLLGIASNVAGLVRRYERLEERFEACRTLNAAQ